MHSFAGSLFIQMHNVPIFITEAFIIPFYLSASSKRGPPATRDASLSTVHELLSNKQLWGFC